MMTKEAMKQRIKQYLENKIILLKDDLQHFTMVEHDKFKSSEIEFELYHLTAILNELEENERFRKIIRNFMTVYRCADVDGSEAIALNIYERGNKAEFDFFKKVVNNDE